jgi:hypothetical protein
MKKVIIISTLLIAGGFLSIDIAFAGVAEDRSFTQRLRIRQGIASGELTRHEAKILKRECLRHGYTG